MTYVFFCPVALSVSFFEFTTIICFTFHLAHAFFLDKCSKCLLCLVFENRRRSFILYQTFWIFDLESNVVIVIISIIVICYFYHYYHYHNFVLSMLLLQVSGQHSSQGAHSSPLHYLMPQTPPGTN